MTSTNLKPNLYILSGAVNTGVLVYRDRAVLFDCCDTVTEERLAALGIAHVDMILCTQHQRPNTAGAYRFAEAGAQVVAPAAERHLFEQVEAYWADPRNRWHIYHLQPGLQVPARPIPVARGVGEGDCIEWEGYTIRVIDTPGATTGSVSYIVDVEGTRYCFSGDLIYGPGQILDLHSLQKGPDAGHDYHAFLGSRKTLIASLHHVRESGADVLVPSHGDPIADPTPAMQLLGERLDDAWANFASIAAMRMFHPPIYEEVANDPRQMPFPLVVDYPDYLKHTHWTSTVLISESGAAFVVDSGYHEPIQKFQEWLRDGVIRSLDFCWVTHYHDDHVDALDTLHQQMNCPIYAVNPLADVIENPTRYFLPCISPTTVPVARRLRDAESWQWHEFTLTAYHFPGQTWYHGGLLAEGRGKKIFFAGDSALSGGIDDYCSANRNLLGPDRGYRRCIDIWRQIQPDFIIAQHMDRALVFTREQFDHMEKILEEREQLYSQMLPWDHPNFGTDPHWVRTWPYEQEIAPGTTFRVDVQFTNHGAEAVTAEVKPVLPEGWTWDEARSYGQIEVPALTDGAAEPWCQNPDGSAKLWLSTPENAAPGRYVLTFRVTWGGRYLGQFRHAIVNVR